MSEPCGSHQDVVRAAPKGGARAGACWCFGPTCRRASASFVADTFQERNASNSCCVSSERQASRDADTPQAISRENPWLACSASGCL